MKADLPSNLPHPPAPTIFQLMDLHESQTSCVKVLCHVSSHHHPSIDSLSWPRPLPGAAGRALLPRTVSAGRLCREGVGCGGPLVHLPAALELGLAPSTPTAWSLYSGDT